MMTAEGESGARAASGGLDDIAQEEHSLQY